MGVCNANGLLDITWTWEAVDQATQYRVRYGTNPDLPWAESTQVNTTDTFLTVTGLALGTWYAEVKTQAGAKNCVPSANRDFPPVTQETCTPPCEWVQGETWDEHVSGRSGRQVKTHDFVPPSGASIGDAEEVELKMFWQWSGLYNQGQVNEDHEVVTPLGTAQCNDRGDEELEGQWLACSPGPPSYLSPWTAADGNLPVTVRFNGGGGSAGSHYTRVTAWWCVTPPLPPPGPIPPPVVCDSPDLSGDYECVGSTQAGFRFNEIDIPQGADIISASLSLYARDWFGSVDLNAAAEAVDDSLDFNLIPLQGRPATTEQANWAFTPGGGWQSSADLSAVLEEVIGRRGWSPGNSLSLLVNDNGSGGGMSVSAHDLAPGEAAKLDITYTIAPDPAVRSLSAQVENDYDDTSANAGEKNDYEPLVWPLIPLSGGSVTVNWHWDEVVDPLGDEVSYRFQLATDSDFDNLILDTGWQTGIREVTTPGLQSGRTYYARVQSHGHCRTSGWTTINLTPNCSSPPGVCGEVPPPRDPPAGWCVSEEVCLSWAWEPAAWADEYRLIVLDNGLSEVADTGWQTSGFFDWDDPYLSYTTCGLNSAETYRGRIGAKGNSCPNERWTDLIEHSVDCSLIPWFQTQEGDVHSQSYINSQIPGTALEPFFSLNGDGSTPGVVSYGLSADFGDGDVSRPPAEWLAQTSLLRDSYLYFYRLLDSPETPNFSDLSDISGDGVYYSPNPVKINSDFPSGGGNRKAVVLVDNEVAINTNINVPSGGFLAIIASGNISLANNVSQIEGVYLTDGELSTGFGPIQLTGEGIFMADSVNLGRDFESDRNTLEPAEKFVFRPDLVLNSPPEIWSTKFTWQELAP